jgi:hypothetical protein
LQEQDAVEPPVSQPRNGSQVRQITPDEFQARGRLAYEVAADVDPDRRSRAAIDDQFGDLGAVAATDVQHRQPGEFAQQGALRRPLDKPIQ